MNCPKEVSDILLDIIYMATLRIRSEATNGDARRCGIEAYHIHNLPNVLKDFSKDLLMHYYELEVRAYVTSSDGVNIQCFEPLWNKLARYIELNRLNAPEQ